MFKIYIILRYDKYIYIYNIWKINKELFVIIDTIYRENIEKYIKKLYIYIIYIYILL